MSIIFISGIDTGVGKSYVTGLLAAYLKQQKFKVITAKLVQTGSTPLADDIQLHRKLMDEPINELDKHGVTCPYVFPFPASPHLAAQKAKQPIDIDKLLGNIEQLQKKYDVVVLEGAGGLRVPLNQEVTILDLIQQQSWPCLLASSARLGSINHTWLAIDALFSIKASVLGLTYTTPPEANPEIAKDTLSLFERQWPKLPIIPIPWLATHEIVDLPNFSMIQFNTLTRMADTIH